MTQVFYEASVPDRGFFCVKDLLNALLMDEASSKFTNHHHNFVTVVLIIIPKFV